MKIRLIFIFVSLTHFLLAQEIKTIPAKVEKLLDFGPEVQREWALRDKLLQNLGDGVMTWDQLTKEEQSVLEKYGEVYADMWDIIGGGCSWYCGASTGSVRSSSHLGAQGNNSYGPSNAHDLSYKSAWSEGVPGYGIGEYLEYEFPAEHPRINKVIIVNGYVKSKNAYHYNSRVKTLKMYVNGTAYALLSLKDIPSEQSFSVAPIGYADRTDLDALSEKPSFKIRFEILEVYKGSKYDDVLISEIFFDGLDVHCFMAGTQVLLPDGSESNIEDLKIGQEVMSLNNSTGELETAKILALASPTHDHLIKVSLADGRTIEATEDHPFFDGQRWLSFNPEKTQTDYDYEDVHKLVIGTQLQTLSGNMKVMAIERLSGSQQTYTIVKLDRNNSFIANGIVVGTEEPRMPVCDRVHAYR